MKPVGFPQANLMAGRGQEEYNQQVGFRGRVTNAGEEFISCYQLTDDEMAKIVKTKRIWMRLFIGEGRPITPNLLQVENPFE